MESTNASIEEPDLSQIGAVIFDLDDTLWSIDALVEYACGSAEDGGLPTSVRLHRAQVTAADWQDVVLAWLQYGQVLFRDVPEVITRLRAEGVKLAIATNLPEWVARPVLRATGLLGNFSATVFNEPGNEPKPSAFPVLRAAELLNVRAERTLMVGDSIDDYLSATAGGVHFAAATWASRDASRSASSHGLHSVAQPLDLLDALRRWS